MAKKKNMVEDFVTSPMKSLGLFAKGTAFFKETPQMLGRISRGLAHDVRGGKGKISKRPTYKKDMKKGIKQQSRQERGKIVRTLARNTKGGKGLISKRPSYKQHVPKR